MNPRESLSLFAGDLQMLLNLGMSVSIRDQLLRFDVGLADLFGGTVDSESSTYLVAFSRGVIDGLRHMNPGRLKDCLKILDDSKVDNPLNPAYAYRDIAVKEYMPLVVASGSSLVLRKFMVDLELYAAAVCVTVWGHKQISDILDTPFH